MTAPKHPSAKTDLLRDNPEIREAFRRGERKAMTQVYAEYLPLVQTVCRHGFGPGFRGFFSPADRDDGVQAIFAAAFEERTRLAYNGLDAYGSFLRGVARNVIRRMLDSHTRFSRTDAPAPQELPDLETSVLDAEAVTLVREFRSTVTEPPEPEVLQRYFCDGWAEERLAVHLGITRYRLRKIVSTLQRRLERYLKSHGITSLH
ncbi:MAG: sigma-70 family RNA polymerase sigma factor [Myxococcota bacterium]|nr:sigma-70 family RNA polymerase sigma factor [Myxococcota bacterium]